MAAGAKTITSLEPSPRSVTIDLDPPALAARRLDPLALQRALAGKGALNAMFRLRRHDGLDQRHAPGKQECAVARIVLKRKWIELQRMLGIEAVIFVAEFIEP